MFAQLKSTGNSINAVGDVAGQLGPIGEGADQNAEIPKSHWMTDITNRLLIHFRKFRRGADQEQFNFVRSIYPSPETTLSGALEEARARYPCKRGTGFAKGAQFPGTCLVMTNAYRMHINSEANAWLCTSDAVKVEAPTNIQDANMPACTVTERVRP